MNPRALQQAIVRMMIDPAFVAQVHGKRPVPGLAEDERALLRAVDRRAFTTDRFRRARAVQALVEEYPCSAAAIGLTAVDAFLSAPEFAACVADRGGAARILLDQGLHGAGATEAVGGERPAIDRAQQGPLVLRQARHRPLAVHLRDEGRVDHHAHDRLLQRAWVHGAAPSLLSPGTGANRAGRAAATCSNSGNTAASGLRSHSTTTARSCPARASA